MSKIATSLPNVAVNLDRASATALYRQLYDEIREAILSGHLSPGTRLPSTRELASELNIARNTVLNAFEQLYAESYLERRIGDGTYVSHQLPDDLLRVTNSQPAPKRNGHSNSNAASFMAVSVANYSGPPRPFRTGTPAFDAFPFRLWGRLLAQRWASGAAEMLQYSDSAGYLPLRKAIASYISTTRGVRCTPEQLLITSGSQHALELVIRTVLNPRDKVWIEDPGFLGSRSNRVMQGCIFWDGFRNMLTTGWHFARQRLPE